MSLHLVDASLDPASLAIRHRMQSHGRPDRSGSPNRKHFASLNVEEHAYFSHHKPTSLDLNIAGGFPKGPNLENFKILKCSSEINFQASRPPNPNFVWGILEVEIENFKRD